MSSAPGWQLALLPAPALTTKSGNMRRRLLVCPGGGPSALLGPVGWQFLTAPSTAKWRAK